MHVQHPFGQLTSNLGQTMNLTAWLQVHPFAVWHGVILRAVYRHDIYMETTVTDRGQYDSATKC